MRSLIISLVYQVANLTLDQLSIPFGKRAGVCIDAMRGSIRLLFWEQVKASKKSWLTTNSAHDTNDVEVIERRGVQMVEK